MRIEIAEPTAADRAGWEALARGYKAFYRDPQPDAVYDRLWHSLTGGGDVHGFVARLDGGIVGIVHYLFHAHSWHGEACYLQDLFTAGAARGKGVATALIGAVAEAARTRGAASCYWLTKEDNMRARALYDRIARFKGFLRYDYPLKAT